MIEGELNAPRRFKTAFIFFSSQRHKQIKEELAIQGIKEKTTNIAKMVSKEWREMPEADRAEWNEKSRIDKARYDDEMQDYNHARKISKTNIRDPNAPRRPMSAFLAFSNKRRASLKREHPSATNADLSKMLSKSWKELSPEIKKEYIDQEALLRTQYKTDAIAWRKKKAEDAKTTASRKVAEEQREFPDPVTVPAPNSSAVARHDDATMKQEQASLLASISSIQNQGGGISYFPGVANSMTSNDLLLGALHNRVYGAPNNNSIDAAILGNLSDQIRLQQQVANQQSYHLQQQLLASSVTGATGYPGQQQPHLQSIQSLAQRLLANHGQDYMQQPPIGDLNYGSSGIADAWINQQVNNSFPLPPGYQNNGWFR